MKVTIYMAATPNGLIAKADDSTGFVSDFEWQGFMKRVYDAGNCIMGRRTFEIMLKDGKFPLSGLNIVLTKRKMKNRWGDKVVFTNKPPKAVLKMITEKGYEEALVCGGAHLNASFMKLGLVDEIVLDIEPHLFTKGIRIFEGKDFNAKLKLLEARQVSPNEVTLRYKVVK